MRNLAGGAVGFLRRLFAAPPDAKAPHSGTAAVHLTSEAVAALEGAICEALVHRPNSASSATDLRIEPAVNAFGVPVRETSGSGARGCLASATGLALTGVRASCAASGQELFECAAGLKNAVARLAPLVVHAALDDGHAGWHAVSGSGAFMALARDAQEALDLTLLARWLAERALVPGVVGFDGEGVERLVLPSDALVREYLGEPGSMVACPTEPQRLLFGPQRRLVHRWFDLDRPVASGGVMGASDATHSRAGRQVLFAEELLTLAQQGMAALTRLTGRPVSFIRQFRVSEADLVLVAQGAWVQHLEALADQLRTQLGWKVGVLGVSWLRPFPAGEVAAALAGKTAVAVVERCAGFDEGPLFQEVAAAAGPRGARWLSAVSGGPELPAPEAVAGVCALLRKADRPSLVRLDLVPVVSATGFPHRDAALNALKAAAPSLATPLPTVEGLSSSLKGRASLALLAPEAGFPRSAVSEFATELARAAGPLVRGTVTRPWPGVVQAHLRAAATEFQDPGPRAPVDVLLVGSSTPVGLGPSLPALVHGGAVVVATDEDPERVWSLFPGGWRKAVETLGLKVFLARGGLGPARSAAVALAKGQVVADLVPVITTGSPPTVDREMPAVVRRVKQARVAMDSLPRHWGEVVQPRQGGIPDGVADVLLSVGLAPGGASALQPPAASSFIPELIVDRCTGCGKCWTLCPESALCASAVSVDAMFTSASARAGTTGKAADALRRSHKKLNAYFGGELSGKGAGALTRARLEAGWSWLAQSAPVPEGERGAHDAATMATTREVLRHQAVVTRAFFEEPESKVPGSGELLVWAVDPRACLGCALCVASCPEQALANVPRTPERVAKATASFKAWEDLPDTSPSTVARLAEHPAIGPMAATLLSRVSSQAQVGDVEGEPGSGERLAARLVMAVAEARGRASGAALATAVRTRQQELETQVRAELATLVSGVGMETVGQALDAATADLSTIAKALAGMGPLTKVDGQSVRQLALHAAELDRLRRALEEGPDGLGRSRVGVVLLGEAASSWAARYPTHPWFAPLAVDLSPEGVELALGIAWGLMANHLELVRALRKAVLLQESPSELDPRIARLERLEPAELTAEEWAGCPRLLVLADETSLTERGVGALSRLLESSLPIKVVVFDGLSRLEGRASIDLVALAHQRATVVASSIADPNHLARGVAAALDSPRAALVHLHAPSPRRHGFAANGAFERARLALGARAHLLLTYHPSAGDGFGECLSLEGNPELSELWSGLDFVLWAAGESRFSSHFSPLVNGAKALPAAEYLRTPPAERGDTVAFIEQGGKRLAVSAALVETAQERLSTWATLKALAGVGTARAEAAHPPLLAELRAAHEADLTALRKEFEAKLAAKATSDQEVVARVADRLMAIAGVARPGERS